jgi:mannose-1-phosphate guanylyltransferase / mannose-6-phosphate isomerase
MLQATFRRLQGLDIKSSLTICNEEHLELMEVQSGPYLGEDDIVTFEDVYGRTSA